MTCQSHSRRKSLPPSLITLSAKRRPLGRTARVAARGFTLIEMLVSLAITLIMMGAVVTLFGVVSESVSKSRSLIETSDRLRAAREVIQQDLQGATASLTPPLSPENGQGYFEIIEGQSSDGGLHSTGQLVGFNTPEAMFGDCDDVLMFTVRSRSGPFLGKFAGAGGSRVIESPTAEVIYFLVQDGPIIDATANPPTRLCTLYRRVLLIAPSLDATAAPFVTPANSFHTANDISVRYENAPAIKLIPNTLGDLTKRENRFAHFNTGTYGLFPFLVDTEISPNVRFTSVNTPAQPASWPPGRPEQNAYLRPFVAERLGDDVLLTNVIAFDVRVWDSQAELRESNGLVSTPSDPGWAGGAMVGSGAYVDLGYDPASLSDLGRVNPHQKPQGGVFLFPNNQTNDRIYDTWSLHYENDGIDQDQDGVFDGGTNGLDNSSPLNGLIDETRLDDARFSEWDTQPPYATPIRGVQITLRVYEPSSQQVREVVIVQNFDTKK